MKRDIDRFMSYVQKEGECWLWRGAKTQSGYGVFSLHSRYFRAHRASYILFKGDIPTGICVCHRCDVRSCVNPDHIFLGSFSENNHDMISKGRARYLHGDDWRSHGVRALRGEDNPGAKLTWPQVIEIRESYTSARDAAERYGVSRSLIGLIRRNKRWQYLASLPLPGKGRPSD